MVNLLTFMADDFENVREKDYLNNALRIATTSAGNGDR